MFSDLLSKNQIKEVTSLRRKSRHLLLWQTNRTRLKCLGSILRNCIFTKISTHSHLTHQLYFAKFVIHCAALETESFSSLAFFFMYFNFSISYSRSYALLLVGCQICLYGPTRNWTCPSSFCGWRYQDWKSWWKIYQDVNRICGVISHEKQQF